MKKAFFAFMAASLLITCSSPVLKWIDTPDTTSGIISFSFKIEGETDLPIGKNPDSSGRIPIVIILPAGTSLENLTPTIEYIGVSLNPVSGRSANFSSPVFYRLTAEDGSTLDYTVKVYEKGASTNEIIRFALDVPQPGASAASVEGVINGNTILVTVPAGTDLKNLTAHVTHTGVTAIDPRNASHSDTIFDFTGDFSEPSLWTVEAQDGGSRSYTVEAAARQKDNAKEITSFSFGVSGETDIIGGEPQPDGKYPIVAVVPESAVLDNTVPAISYRGASISPSPETMRNFTGSTIYTVTAEDGSTREYVVKIVRKNDITAGEKMITGFYFMDPLVEGVIDQLNHTIALTVPAGTNLSALKPEIYYKGASVSPISGQQKDFTGSDTAPVIYTVRDQDRNGLDYGVYVFTAPAPPAVDVPGSGSGAKVDVGVNTDGSSGAASDNYTVIVEFPVYIENPVLNITYPAASTVDNETINQILNQLLLLQNKEVYNHITNETINNYIVNSNTTNNTNYTEISSDINVDVTVINPPSDTPAAPSANASIDGFYFTDPAAVGRIDQAAGTISVTVPHGTNLGSLSPTIFYTGTEIVGITGPSPVTPSAGIDFTGPVDYTVKGQGGITEKTYQVTVRAALDNAKDITAFSFDGITGVRTVISAVPNADGKYPIEVTVPAGQPVTALRAQITHTGASIVGQNISSSGSPATATAAVDHSLPRDYMVRAQNGETRTYTVTVRHETGEGDPGINGFYFTSPAAVGEIDQAAGTISVTVPYGTNLGGLSPTIYYTGAELVEITGPSPVTAPARDFTGPVDYRVKGQDGITEKTYRVTVRAALDNAKDITVFSFDGITAHTVISAVPNTDGKYPIEVTVPDGQPVTALKAQITYTGASIAGQNISSSGGPGSVTASAGVDHSLPGDYTVRAQNDETRTYTVTVRHETGEGDPGIDGFYFTSPAAVGRIDQTAGTISVTVPYGTNLGTLIPTIYYTGAELVEITGPSPVTPSMGINFTGPVDYTVKGQNGITQKTYRVTVRAALDNAKDITAFSFDGITSHTVISAVPNADGKYPIEVTVPGGQPVTALRAQITHTGASIAGPNITSGLGSVTASAAVDHSLPGDYTVRAQNGETRTYTVTVRHGTGEGDPGINGFYFTSPAAVGEIDQAAGTISVTVPHGTILGSLIPTIYYTGTEIVGITGPSPVTPSTGIDFTGPVDYTAKGQDGITEKTYQVTVRAALDNAKDITAFSFDGITGVRTVISAVPSADGKYPIEVTVPAGQPVTALKAQITHTGASIAGPNITSGPGSVTASAALSYRSPQDYTVRAENGETRTYTVTVRHETGEDNPEIDGFYFTSPAAVGEIDQAAGTISVTVPYGTDLRNLTAGICYAGKEIAGVPGVSPLKDTRSFTGPVDYTVKGRDGITEKSYQVRVEAALDNAKDITAFSFDGITGVRTVISAMPNADGKYPVEVTVPAGQPVTALRAQITHTGASIAGQNINSSSGPGAVTASAAVDHSLPQDYTVKAQNDETRTYTVTVHHEAGEDDPEILGFYFTNPLAVGLVNQNANTITVTVPFGANTAALAPAVYFKGVSVKPASGSVNDFGSPLVYTVTGRTGKTRAYTVTVIPTLSSARDITRFTFPGITTETIIGAIPDAEGNYPISVWVPAGTDLSSRAPDITHTGASISPPGGTALDFGASQTYTVTAEDGSVKTYRVTAGAQSGDTKIITSLVFEEVPLTGGGSVRVIASIDQASYSIRAEVPYAAAISALKPTIAWIGRSIAGPAGGDKTANPFTDAPEDFSSPKTYTVKDQSGAGQPYTVTVIRKSSVAVGFTGETDREIIAENIFNQTTGVITVTVNSQNVSPPYEWYLDGVKQPVSSTQGVFTLNIGDGTFVPGRHEIMVSGKKSGLHYTGKVYFTVSGGAK